jgi:hypothetical protein
MIKKKTKYGLTNFGVKFGEDFGSNLFQRNFKEFDESRILGFFSKIY